MSEVLSNAILNVNSKIDALLALSTDSPSAGITLKESYLATAGQTVFNLVNNYALGTNNISVYVNGVRQAAFTETSTTSITFDNPLSPSDEVVFLINEFNASVFEQVILDQTEDARDAAIAAKDAAELAAAELALIDVGPLLDVVSVNGTGNISTFKGSAGVRIEGGTSTNYLSALTLGGVEEEVLIWTDEIVQVATPLNLVSPNGLVAKQLTINNLGQLVFDGTVIS